MSVALSLEGGVAAMTGLSLLALASLLLLFYAIDKSLSAVCHWFSTGILVRMTVALMQF